MPQLVKFILKPEDELLIGSDGGDGVGGGVGGGGGGGARAGGAMGVAAAHPSTRAPDVFSFDVPEGEGVHVPFGRLPRSPAPLSALRPGALAQLVECPVCGERLREPRALPCQHTFCAECLAERLRPAGDRKARLECVACGAEATLALKEGPDDAAAAAEAVRALPSNSYLESLLRLLPSSPSPASSPAPGDCARCGAPGTAVDRCFHCAQMLCEVCWARHLSELELQLGVLASELDAASERLQLLVSDYQESCAALRARAAAEAEARRAAVREAEERVAVEVAALEERARADAEALTRALAAATLSLRGGAGSTLDPLADNLPKVSAFLRAQRAATALLERVARWGDARPAFDAEAFRVEELPPPPSPQPAPATPPTDPDDDETTPDAPQAKAQHFRVRAWAPRMVIRRSALQRPAGAGLAPWAAELYVSAADAHAVLVLDWGRGRLLRRITAPEMLCPQGIAFCATSQEVYVADKFKHCVHVFSRSGALLRSLGRKGSAPGQLRAPEGLASAPGPDPDLSPDSDPGRGTGQTTLLYVCDAGNDRVQVLRADTGAVVRLLGVTTPRERGPCITEFNQPTAVAVSPALDLLAVTDTGHNRVKLYALSTGAKVRELGCRGARRGQLRLPEGVALCAQGPGFVVVGDCGNARLQVFRADDGRLERVLGAGVFLWPAALACTPQDALVVCDTRSHVIYVL